jgi:predicted acylesterase/phospholipase RssA
MLAHFAIPIPGVSIIRLTAMSYGVPVTALRRRIVLAHNVRCVKAVEIQPQPSQHALGVARIRKQVRSFDLRLELRRGASGSDERRHRILVLTEVEHVLHFSHMKAVVFGAGGLFGAYHIGAWKVLSRHFEPDLIVGVSIGSLIGWLIAGGYPLETLERDWLTGERYERPRLRLPRSPLHGLLNPKSVHRMMMEMVEAVQPKIRYAVVACGWPRLDPVVYEGPSITWRHLAASCAVPLMYDAQRIDGRILLDGGLRDTCPVHIARELGATSIIGLNCWKQHGERFQRGDDWLRIGTPEFIGSRFEAFLWKRANIERWMAHGERDASDAVAAGEVTRLAAASEKTFTGKMF